MLDWRSAGQFVGLMLVVRVLAYWFVRLIEKIKPRPVHFIITAAIEPSFVARLAQKKIEIATRERLSQNKRHKYSELGKQFLKMVRRNFYYYRFNFINLVRSRRRAAGKRFSLKLMTEIVGLLTAGISLVTLVLERIFK